MRKLVVTKALCLSLLIVCTPSHSQMLQNLLIGNAKAISLGNAVTADPPGIDSIHFNPAGLARLKGRQYELKFLLADVTIEGEFQLNNQDVIDKNEAKGLVDPLADSKTTIDNFAIYLPGGGHTDLPVLAAPLGGISYNAEGSKFTFATSVYAPMILGMTRKEDDPGTVYGEQLSISRITYFSPSVGYQMTESLAVGLSLGFSYVGLGVKLDYRAPSQLVEEVRDLTNDLCGRSDEPRYFLIVPDSFLDLDICRAEIDPYKPLFNLDFGGEKVLALTYNLGVLWEANDWLTLGLTYQSESEDKLEGVFNMEILELTDIFNGLAESSLFGSTELLGLIVRDAIRAPEDGIVVVGGHVTLTTPQHLSVGASIQVLPNLKINVDVKWTETSKWETLTFQFEENVGLFGLFTLLDIDGAQPDALIVPRGYVDTVNWGIGFEYAYSSKLDLRLGYEPRKTGIPDNKRDYLIPLSDLDLFAAGFSYKLSKHSTFELAVVYTKSEMFIPTGSSTNGNDTRYNNFIYNPTAGLDTYSLLEVFILETSYRTTF
ncbi:MAG: outer membrane protein transport protein [Pseudomonadales bacterium]|nr:outer membrane protein transport protein [Pseudomonadales bacterium]